MAVARARRYLRQHLGEEVALGEVAKAAGASPYHFARLYHAMTGETVFTTLTRFRLERAAQRLSAEPKRPVSEIALEVGFATPSSFAKAFRAATGLSPTEHRAGGAELQEAARRALAPPPRTEAPGPRASWSGPVWRERGAVRVIRVRELGDYGDLSAPLAWERLAACFAGTDALQRYPHIGATHDDPRVVAAAALRYDAGLIVEDERVAAPAGAVAESWEGGRYAVFLHRGAYSRIDASFEEIAREWSLRAQPVLRDAPYLEVYVTSSRDIPEEELLTELWIPVQPAGRARRGGAP